MDKIREVRLRDPSPMILPPDGGVAYVIVVVCQQQHQQDNETLRPIESEYITAY